MAKCWKCGKDFDVLEAEVVGVWGEDPDGLVVRCPHCGEENEV
jgi:DNA-directed RNA polymerase subunit RPC12/RpoP